jgi:hypothetical protein
VVDEGLARAEDIVSGNLDNLKALANALLEREILDREEVEKILKGEKLPAPVRTHANNAGGAPVAPETSGSPAEQGAMASTAGDAPGAAGAEQPAPPEEPVRSPEDKLD